MLKAKISQKKKKNTHHTVFGRSTSWPRTQVSKLQVHHVVTKTNVKIILKQ